MEPVWACLFGGEGPRQPAAGCPRDGNLAGGRCFLVRALQMCPSLERVASELASTQSLIERYYNDLWNHWTLDLIPELISPQFEFRGSLGIELSGHDAFRDYMRMVRTAFPDFHNRIDDLLIDWDRAAVRLTYSGTHAGVLFGILPTGRRIEYQGAAFFTTSRGHILSGWVLGDTFSLFNQIGQNPDIPAR